MQTSKGEIEKRTFKYLDPYDPEQKKSSNVKLSLDSSGWGIWQAIKTTHERIDDLVKDNVVPAGVYDFSNLKPGELDNNLQPRFKSLYCQEFYQDSRWHPTNATVKIYGDLCVQGNIWIRDDRKGNKQYIKRCKKLGSNPGDEFKEPYAYTWSIGDIDNLQNELSSKLSTNSFNNTYLPKITKNETDISELQNMNNKHTEDINNNTEGINNNTNNINSIKTDIINLQNENVFLEYTETRTDEMIELRYETPYEGTILIEMFDANGVRRYGKIDYKDYHYFHMEASFDVGLSLIDANNAIKLLYDMTQIVDIKITNTLIKMPISVKLERIKTALLKLDIPEGDLWF